MLAHAAGTDDRAQRARDASLPADHLAEIVLRDVQAKHDRVGFLDSLDAHGIRLVDKLPCQVLEQLRHSYRVRFLILSSLLTASDGKAPLPSQSFTRSSSNSINDGSCCGL